MANLSAEQLMRIAQALHDTGVALEQVRLNAIHAGRGLGDPEVAQLLAQALSLLNMSSSFAVGAAQVSLNDVAGAVNGIGAATAAAEAALGGLQTLDKALRVGGSVIVLGTSVFTGDPQAIGHAAEAVFAAARS